MQRLARGLDIDGEPHRQDKIDPAVTTGSSTKIERQLKVAGKLRLAHQADELVTQTQRTLAGMRSMTGAALCSLAVKHPQPLLSEVHRGVAIVIACLSAARSLPAARAARSCRPRSRCAAV